MLCLPERHRGVCSAPGSAEHRVAARDWIWIRLQAPQFSEPVSLRFKKASLFLRLNY